MKKILLFISLLIMGGTVFAEEPYKVIVLPTVNNTIIITAEMACGATNLQIGSSIDEINKVVSEKIDQTICLPKYKKVEMVDKPNEQYINTLPEKDFLLNAVKESGADGILAFEISRIDFAKYNAEPLKANCIISCHVKTFNAKKGIYIDEKFVSVSEPYNAGCNKNKLREVLINSVNEALNKIFSKLPV